MASMRESDTGLWLHNKLGSADELWAPPSIASLLTKDVVDNIRVCFHGLSSAVKLKLLLGILHLPKRTVDEMKSSLTEIVHLAAMDTDSWVHMVADILKTFPETGSLNLELEEHNQNLQEILGELREKVNECEASAMLPLECQYLNKNALTTLVGPLTPPVKHFQLKRKPKSATLRAELLQKSTETAQQLKKTSGVPFLAKGRGLVKKLDTTTPLKGIPKQAPFRSPTTPSVFSPSTNRTPMAVRTPMRKERGVKLLDISELDMVGAGREAKRRRKTLGTAAVTTTAPTTPTPQQTQQQTQPQQAQPLQQPRKSLSLTRDQMYAAQEMFKTANKVTRPEKALILGFMAGSRENPCPEQGDIIQIKLSEHTEVLPKADGTGSTTMLVDTVFEMNYATGQWTRLKKYKPITNVS
ncbi:hypothetical protein scyTo_0010609 [Scyliorhinus torazame]|uniref:HDAg domain-containing protein n=1 Tax=Scyliorhinus torazame TaxID=75743 RepID=A0A401P9C2_SCYTO|nr:hypothetical protein [Scyliorhinus torazame]